MALSAAEEPSPSNGSVERMAGCTAGSPLTGESLYLSKDNSPLMVLDPGVSGSGERRKP